MKTLPGSFSEAIQKLREHIQSTNLPLSDRIAVNRCISILRQAHDEREVLSHQRNRVDALGETLIGFRKVSN